MRIPLKAALAALLATALPVLAVTEEEGLAQVKSFTLDHAGQLVHEAQALQGAAGDYAATIAAHGGDYAAAWQAEPDRLKAAIRAMRDRWLAAHNQYETIEGIVAGLPSTGKYDLILDAGNPGSDPEDVADYDLALPDGTVLQKPGNLFHKIAEPLYWATDAAQVKLAVDLDGDGKTTAGEALFDANLAQGAADGLARWTAALQADIAAWTPNRDDAFTALVTMTPTIGEYIGEWKESHFMGSVGGAFVAQSRLVDAAGIMAGCQRMYGAAISPVVASGDAALDAAITRDYADLLALIEDTHAREAKGDAFTSEEADAIGADAQDIADRIVAQVLQAAARNGVQIKG